MQTPIKSFPNNSKFFYVSPARFVLMSFCTLGLFEVYWIYKNFQFIKQYYNEDMMPFWRAIFSIFFISDLLKDIAHDRELNEIKTPTFNPVTLATGWIILNLVGNILSRFDNETINVIGILLATPSFLFLLPVQNFINEINEALPEPPEEHGWSAGQIVVLVIGLPIFLLVALGLVVSLFGIVT